MANIRQRLKRLVRTNTISYDITIGKVSSDSKKVLKSFFNKSKIWFENYVLYNTLKTA
jgi:hypothetical protein